MLEAVSIVISFLALITSGFSLYMVQNQSNVENLKNLPKFILEKSEDDESPRYVIENIGGDITQGVLYLYTEVILYDIIPGKDANVLPEESVFKIPISVNYQDVYDDESCNVVYYNNSKKCFKFNIDYKDRQAFWSQVVEEIKRQGYANEMLRYYFHHYVQIQYADYLGRQHEENYEIDSTGHQLNKISNEEAKKVSEITEEVAFDEINVIVQNYIDYLRN